MSTQLILSTTAASSASQRIAENGNPRNTDIMLWGGAFLLLLPVGLRYRWLAAMMLIVLAGSMLSLTGCGGTASASAPATNSQPPQPPTNPAPPSGPGAQAENYTITVSATSDTSVSPPPPVPIQLTVD
jgi:hypothetical protein